MKKLIKLIPVFACMVACNPEGSAPLYATLEKNINTNLAQIGESFESSQGSGSFYDVIYVSFVSGEDNYSLDLLPTDFTAKKGDVTLTGEFFIISYITSIINNERYCYANETSTIQKVECVNGSCSGNKIIAFSEDLDNTYDIFYKSHKLIPGEMVKL